MTNHSGSAADQLAAAQLLDTGAQAEIYEWGEGRVLRLLAADGSEAQLAREAEVMRAAAAAGLPVPAVHELLVIDGRPGMVLDRIDGGSMLSTMLGRPWRLLPLIRRFGEIQAGLHSVTAPIGTPQTHPAVAEQLARLGANDAGLREWATRELEQLPDGNSLLHGDYHPLNLLMDGHEARVIDWPDATAGPAEADIARTLVLIEASDPPNGSPVMLKLLGLFRTRLFIPRYLRAYGRVRPLDRELVDRWRVVRLIERLVEGPATEQPILRQLIAEAGVPA